MSAQLSYSRMQVEADCTDKDCQGSLFRGRKRGDTTSVVDKALEIATHHATKTGHETIVRLHEEIIIRSKT